MKKVQNEKWYAKEYLYKIPLPSSTLETVGYFKLCKLEAGNYYYIMIYTHLCRKKLIPYFSLKLTLCYNQIIGIYAHWIAICKLNYFT